MYTVLLLLYTFLFHSILICLHSSSNSTTATTTITIVCDYMTVVSVQSVSLLQNCSLTSALRCSSEGSYIYILCSSSSMCAFLILTDTSIPTLSIIHTAMCII